MLGPIIRLLTVAVSIVIAANSPVAWYWRIVIFVCAMAILDRLVAAWGARETNKRGYSKRIRTIGHSGNYPEVGTKLSLPAYKWRFTAGDRLRQRSHAKNRQDRP